MRVRDVEQGYIVVMTSWYKKYRQNAFVDRICATKEEAEYVKASLIKNDGKDFIIIKNE